jgi:hypothetical protein
MTENIVEKQSTKMFLKKHWFTKLLRRYLDKLIFGGIMLLISYKTFLKTGLLISVFPVSINVLCMVLAELIFFYSDSFKT